MTAVVLGVATGFLAAQLIWRMSAGLFKAVVLQRPNYRGHYLPTGAGIVLALAVATVEGGRALAAAAGVGSVTGPGVARTVMLGGLFGFGALGFIDDVLGGDAERGWRAHLRALAAGRLSAGGVKLFGGGVLALMLASAAGSTASGGGGALRLAADGALVALAANLGNAFDRAPGRTIKVSLVILFIMVVRWTIPRFRFDQLMSLAWKVLIPLAIANLVCVMIVKQLDASLLWLLPLTLGVLVVSAWLGTLSAPTTPSPRMAIRGGGQSAD